jgi:hypothetical protein
MYSLDLILLKHTHKLKLVLPVFVFISCRRTVLEIELVYY